jgi:hypothetical protein
MFHHHGKNWTGWIIPYLPLNYNHFFMQLHFEPFNPIDNALFNKNYYKQQILKCND